MRTLRLSMIGALILFMLPASAAAQQESIEARTPQDALVPFVGLNDGGGAFGTNPFTAISIGEKPKSYGASLLFWGPGLLAGEFDFGYNPSFFDNKNLLGVDNSHLTLTANFVLGPTFYIGETMRVRPYGLIGGGLMRSTVSGFTQNLSFRDADNKGVVDVAGGFYYYPHPRIGVRADVRYFQGVGAKDNGNGWGFLDNWNYFRASIGAAVAF